MSCDQNRFKNSNIVIFGGTTGIGLMTAIDFVENGATHIIVIGRSKWKWDRAKNKIKDVFVNDIVDKDDVVFGDKVEIGESSIEYMQGDVRVESDVKTILDAVIEKYTYVNVYFNNAGVQPTIGNSDGSDITKLDIESHRLDDGSIIYRIPMQSSLGESVGPCSTPASDFCENPIATSVIGMFYCLKWEMFYAFEQKKDISVSIINTSSRNGLNIPSAERPIYSASKAFIH